MFDYSSSVRNQRTINCSPDFFMQVVKSTKVELVCKKIAVLHKKHVAGKIADKDFAKQKNAQKSELPVFLFHATFKDHRRSNLSATPSGLSIFDIDHVVDGGKQEAEGGSFGARLISYMLKDEKITGKEDVGKLKELGIVLVHKTPSCEGVRLVFVMPQGMTLMQAQMWMAERLGMKTFDESCKDYARCSFAVPLSYILYFDKDGLFADHSPKPQASGDAKKLTYSTTQQLKNSEPQKLIHYDTKPIDCNSIVDSTAHHGSAGDKDKQGGQRPQQPRQADANDLSIFDNVVKSCNLTIQDLSTEGRRHTSLVVVLGSGITRIIPIERLWACIEERIPEYSQEPDCRKLVEDFYTKYNDPNRPLSFRMQKIFTDSIHPLHKDNEDEDSQAEDEDSEQQLSTAISLDKLPSPLRASLKCVDKAMQMPVLCALLPLLGAYADKVEVRYIDGQKHKLSLMSLIIGPQASGKSTCTRLVHYWLEPMLTDDKNARDLETQWKKEVSTANLKKQDPPERPAAPIRCVPVTISCSALLRRLKLSQGHTLYSLCEELDTLVKTNGSGSWSEKYDIYRIAFDNGLWGQDYNSDVAESGMARVNYNLTLMGTYGAFKRCFTDTNIENGLSSRFLIAEMPDYSFAPLQEQREPSGEDLKAIKEGVGILSEASGLKETPILRKAISEWVEKKRLEALAAFDTAKDTYPKRSAVIGFRCGVIYMLLDGGKESQEAAKFATLIAEYTLATQCKFFGETFAKIESGAQIASYRSKHTRLFDALPSTFTKQMVMSKLGNVTNSAFRMMIHRWVKQGWIKKSGDNEWTKTSFRNV